SECLSGNDSNDWQLNCSQMFGYFDGDFRRRPQQSLGGTHKDTKRQQLLEKAAEERRHREELRRRTNCALVIQSFIRGCLLRKRQVIVKCL
ncbi:unnamed protein product, partial [Oppiella nova]